MLTQDLLSASPPPGGESSIRFWTPGDRPRERLLDHGTGTLSDAELLAIVLGSGSGTRTAMHLGRGLLVRFGALRDLASRDVRDYASVEGIGPAKGARLAAAFEIGRRVSRQPAVPRPSFRSPDDIHREYAPYLRDLKREIFKVVLLNTANVRINDFTASEGGLAASIVEPRLVFRRAILDHAASVICIHNHPSGNPEPSREDIRITQQLVQAGNVVGIPLRDHVIVAGDRFTSMAERGLLRAC